MTYGLMIIADLKELNENDKRLFRKKRRQLMRKIKLKREKNGVYIFPFANPEPSQKEVQEIDAIEELIRSFNVKA